MKKILSIVTPIVVIIITICVMMHAAKVPAYQEYIPEGYAVIYIPHVVKLGDTVEGIVEEYKIRNEYIVSDEATVREISRLNSLGKTGGLVAGTTITVPCVVKEEESASTN